MTPVDVEWVKKNYGLLTEEEVLTFMLDDFRRVYPVYIGPELPISKKTGAQMTVWPGVTFKDGDYSLDGFPLANATMKDIENYICPKVEWFDFSSFSVPPETSKNHTTICGEPFSLLDKAYDLMGMENIMIKMFEAPDLIHALMEKITQSRYDMIKRILETAPWVDIFIITDELGTQESLLMSPEQFREFSFPYHKRLVNLIHSYGKLVYYHSCGCVMPLVPDLVELGIDILDNLQPTAKGNDPWAIKRNFGNKLILHVQVDEQIVMREWKPKDVYSKYRKMIEDLAVGGGFIISTTFRSQDTPRENVEALLQAIRTPLIDN
ncbi:MAG: hypothetical protein A2268_11725 [Candidatus Raymondbacteria bacterium RifOxyA12_full_50_37]|uniref:Uroporphyrinogen decarboxylase (URO-D) domain-containing protein n=1 Tax=Candidatus Raymondbacteria bacterium RIFOXYD12_FULL_49_13 TaxID=1817890 RepID=A0A1F7FJM1_UNCRA|nr:MAG: hypothetical protein A2248_18940 [Candidatus Raymondbacteria bacterium RIFOXYA2_FULL_49_16]OGJ91825.1 MAG: hypothetical protein A2268_11725 [Candidatus Raymondbacteria bacterium RifOxyA12_full_50_37]OGJ92692.1 MAG: hypothetical protein A2350_04030 [Candidatus Raymondbacteria bacterium RifOxyB12_full_50_8]OGJ95419.1 MAG: hypothetical protein A2453_09160 [Candidatus Raymondbacteria bacterium RIFOXYC2_FULL_50_21]OGJ97849.1 MAG: hypothetical protein A2487_17660 [Candidatus Raymondbacteria b